MNRRPLGSPTFRRRPTSIPRSLTVLLGALLQLILLAGVAAAAPRVWVERSTTKVRPSARPGTADTAEIHAARNEFEAFQIVVQSPEGVAGIRATASALSGPGGASIAASAVRLYRVDLMKLARPSDDQGGTGLWPDPLIPAVDDLDGSEHDAFPFEAAPGQARAIWVEVLVPADAAPGEYTGTVQVTSSSGELATVPVKLEVFGFTLPSTPTLRSYYQVNDIAVCRGHLGGDGSCNNDEAKVDLLDRYARFALDHRLTLGNIFYIRPSGGDWRHFDAQYAPLFDGTAPTRLAGAQLTSASYMMKMEPDQLAAYQSHMGSRGWLDRSFDYTADEPGWGSAWGDISPRAQLVHGNAPGLKTLVTTTVDQADDHGLGGAIDIFTPVVNQIDGQPGMPFAGNQRSRYDARMGSGASLWLYQSCMSHGCGGEGAVGAEGQGYPSVMIDHSSTRNRAMHWVTYRYGATGDLYWETVYAYNESPWESVDAFTGNGDGTLFYPGTPSRVGGAVHTPVASQRLKHLRDGVEDYEYLAMVARLGDPEYAAKVARMVAPRAYTVGDDPDRIEKARLALARRIAELTAEGKSATAEVPASTGAMRADHFQVNPAAGQITSAGVPGSTGGSSGALESAGGANFGSDGGGGGGCAQAGAGLRGDLAATLGLALLLLTSLLRRRARSRPE